ncbi:amino acid transmembrane transporter [Schizosaccharomyces osmophilus]|uniref:Amino acid transmembrane transporter n=1 Tax=Schizosaccharomyces osmophilus TaxID=2545709 RepID=A0AAE9WHI3_9SCHI|nr:amino acid transmembrane transporter [Schizosaccharomyces osmophilus]WBW74633.1 amino acid transmembrane transporter [Schizosaccharomyces osmophilus]
MASQSSDASFPHPKASSHPSSTLGIPEKASSGIDIEVGAPANETDNPEDLGKLGYKQEFHRNLSLFSVFSISFSLLGLLPSVATTMTYNLGYVGSPGLVWGWIIAIALVECVALSMAELCSSMPTSGGLYYAAAVLAPKGWGPFASWVTGWSNYLGQLIGGPSINYSTASMLLGAVSVARPSYTPSNYQLFLVTLLITAINAFIASLPTKLIARFNSVSTYLNTLFLFITIIVILAFAGKNHGFNETHAVWGDITNYTDWPDGFAVIMSFCGAIWTMSGYDAPFHMSEETANASVNAPRGIVLTATIGGLMGWVMQLVIAYTMVDQNTVVHTDSSMWATYLSQVMSQKAAIAIISLTVVSSFIMGQGNAIACSRIAYSYARDGVLPFSGTFAKVNSKTKTPVNAVLLDFSFHVCVLLLIFAGGVTIDAVFSVTAIGAFVAFTTPICMRVFFKDNNFRPGPWNLGKFSRVIGALACFFVALMIPVLCFPTVKKPAPVDMNWTCLVFGGPMTLIILWYVVSARKWFKGPRTSTDNTYIVEGVEPVRSSSASVSTKK